MAFATKPDRNADLVEPPRRTDTHLHSHLRRPALAGTWLFLRSRRAPWLCFTMVCGAIIGRLLGPRGFIAGEQPPVLVPWVLFLSAIFAYAIAGAATSPAPWLDRLAARCIPVYSRTLLAFVALLAMLALWWATEALPPPLSTVSALRNLLGLLGLSLLCVATLGVTVGWTIPSGTLFAAIIFLRGDVAFWPVDWLFRVDTDLLGITTALTLLSTGLASTSTRAFRLRIMADRIES